jgi:hypothetical protein
MCKLCVAVMHEIFPEVPEKEVGDFLMSCTCYPFGGPEELKKQLVDLRQKAGDDYKRCYAIADEELEFRVNN